MVRLKGMRSCLLLVALLACGGAGEDAPLPPTTVPCSPAPEGFVAWASGELVMVSKPLGNAPVGGVLVQHEIRSVAAAALPARVDFGAELIEVRSVDELCIIAPGE